MKKTTILEMNRLSVEEFRNADKLPLIVVLDDVRSLYNVGSVFRTSDAFRVQMVCLCGITATPDSSLKASQEIHKTALGAEETVQWRYFKDTLSAVEWLKNEGYNVLAIEQCHGSTMLEDFKVCDSAVDGAATPHLAIVLGNEVKGVKQEVVDACDGCIEIPQYGTKHSLNVSVTAGIVIYSLSSQLLQGRQ